MKNRNLKMFKWTGTTGMRGVNHLFDTLADGLNLFNEWWDDASADYKKYDRNNNYKKYYINCHEHGSFYFEISEYNKTGWDCAPYGVIFVRNTAKHDNIYKVLKNAFNYFTHAMNGDFSLELTDQELLNWYNDVYECDAESVDAAAEAYNESESYVVDEQLHGFNEWLKEVI